MKLRGEKIDWGFVAVLIMVWAYFFPTPSDVRTAFSPSIQRLDRVSERATNEIAASLAETPTRDRKSTRLNSSHGYTAYAVFGLKKTGRPGSGRVNAASGRASR